jgi:hypothetical protein
MLNVTNKPFSLTVVMLSECHYNDCHGAFAKLNIKNGIFLLNFSVSTGWSILEAASPVEFERNRSLKSKPKDLTRLWFEQRLL